MQPVEIMAAGEGIARPGQRIELGAARDEHGRTVVILVCNPFQEIFPLGSLVELVEDQERCVFRPGRFSPYLGTAHLDGQAVDPKRPPKTEVEPQGRVEGAARGATALRAIQEEIEVAAPKVAGNCPTTVR